MSQAEYCAQCGNTLVCLPHGAHQQCCNGLGYWSPHCPAPDSEDRTTIPQVKAPSGNVYYLYTAQHRWKPGMRIPKVKPKFATA